MATVEKVPAAAVMGTAVTAEEARGAAETLVAMAE